MKKFSITKLENARKDPTAFANALKKGDPDSGGFFGRSQFIRWQDAVSEFHKTNDLTKSMTYLEKTFSGYADNSKNRKSYGNYLQSLDAYIKALKKSGHIYLKRESIKLSLNAKASVTGNIPLSFMNNKGGFSLYFFSKLSDGWENELKYPIIQNYFAGFYGTDLDKIEVGIFSTEHNKFFEQSFSDLEVDTANKELEKIGKIIFDIL